MVIAAQCLGLRVSELLVLKWSDIDFTAKTMRITRGIVNGRIDTVKTEYSEDDLRWLAGLLKSYRTGTLAGVEYRELGFSQILTRASRLAQVRFRRSYILRPAKNSVSTATWWHTFRHTYRSMLDATGAPMGVQRETHEACEHRYHDERVWQCLYGTETRG